MGEAGYAEKGCTAREPEGICLFKGRKTRSPTAEAVIHKGGIEHYRHMPSVAAEELSIRAGCCT